jgi:prepilin-type N-terminal cleavage/methylation domain-containing protein
MVYVNPNNNSPNVATINTHNLGVIVNEQRGFTIVELLIVIIVIGILAAITIVSYGGVSQRANNSKASANSDSVQKIAENFYSENGYYPQTYASFSSALTATKLPATITFSPTLSAANGTTTVRYEYCGAIASPPATGALGARIRHWDYVNSQVSTTDITYLGSGVSAAGTASCNTYNDAS